MQRVCYLHQEEVKKERVNKEKKEEATKVLEALLYLVISDVDRILKALKEGDWEKARQIVKQIKERKAKIGI